MKESAMNLPYRPCVGIMLLNINKEVFVGRRIDSSLEAWQMPQGGIDSGEDPTDAAFRELHEETGIVPNLVDHLAMRDDWLFYDLPLSLLPQLWGGRFRGQKQKWFLFRFLGSDNQIKIDMHNPEFSEWRWLLVSELVQKIVPFKKDIYSQVINGFSRFLN